MDDVRDSFGLAVCVVWLVSVILLAAFGYVAISVALETSPERTLLQISNSGRHPARAMKEAHARKAAVAKIEKTHRKEPAKTSLKANESRKQDKKRAISVPRRAKPFPAQG
ncbi:hypothetical protein [Methylocystis heyeri]|uniref:Uncharacterized protein n=1 Tax=Methylocystis heyeri TaxID=391905 RepID=A0A6B8KKH7_9HYPH|nr:hypothetical protein [Methylocystis heyeri]QGM47180.1 hypothetical protein H2LOC_016585 [Methylocystis heyeri]